MSQVQNFISIKKLTHLCFVYLAVIDHKIFFSEKIKHKISTVDSGPFFVLSFV